MKQSQTKWQVAGLLASPAFCLALAGCKAKVEPQAEAPTPVPVVAVARASLSNDLVLSAEFTPFQNVDVMAKVAGFVKQINVDLGDHVRQGQVLATLDVPELQDELAKANAQLLAAQANITTATSAIARSQATSNMSHLSFTRIQGVSKSEPGLVPQQDIDLAQAHDLESQASLAGAESALQAARQSSAQAVAERDRAGAMLQYAVIRAPFTGVITKRYANTGSMIQAGTASQTQAMPLVQLAQDNVLRLTLPVPVTDVGGIHIGEPVDINIAALGKTLRGTVTRFSDNVQMSTRTMDTEVDLPNNDGTLVPGMYAEAHLHMAARPDVLSAPIDAVDGLGTASQHAYIVRDGRLFLVSVTTGIQTAERVEILGGVKQGDLLVVGRHTGLSDGQRVEPRPASYESAGGNTK